MSSPHEAESRGEDDLMRGKGISVVVSGPSGVGKSTLCKQMIERVPRTTLSISYTTRKPRSGERDGVEYWFVEEEKFHAMVRDDAFVEWAEVYGRQYGTPKRPLLEAMDGGVDVLLEIDTQGAKQIMERLQQAVFVFVAPPSLDVLKTRLDRRGAETPEEIQQRLQGARNEMANVKAYHYLIRNEDLHQATKELESVILAERIKTHRLSDDWFGDDGVRDPLTMREMAI